MIEFLVKLGKKRKQVNVLIPASEASLIPVSKNKILLGKYFRLMVCDWKTAGNLRTNAKFIE